MKNSAIALYIFLACLLINGGCRSDKNEQKGQATDKRPNIVLVIVDDLGKDALSSYNPAARPTPHLDLWANEGRRFDNFYVTSPVCSPSRASLLTGCTPKMTGIEDVLKPNLAGHQIELANSLPTLATVLKEKDYHTFLVGKWHLGYQTGNHPLERGFDKFKGFLSGHIDYLSHVGANGRFGLMDDREAWIPNQPLHLTSLFTNEAIELIQAAPAQHPYFLMLAYATPHRPYLLPGEEALFPGGVKPGKNQPDRYERMVALLDHEIGRLHKAIRETDENTIIIFLSDNGAAINAPTRVERLKGKSSLFEGGINVPAFAYWPEKIQPAIVPTLQSSLDLYPTLLNVAQVSDYSRSQDLSSKKNILNADNGHSHLTWMFNDVKGVRKGPWKALFIPDDDAKIARRHFVGGQFSKHQELLTLFDGHYPLLFNLQTDPVETIDLALEEVDILKELWRIYQNSK